MDFKLLLNTVLLLLQLSCLFGQGGDSTNAAAPATQDPKNAGPFIEYMNNYINLKLSFSSEVEKFVVNTPGPDIKLSPNTTSDSRLYFNYRFISFSIKYIPNFLPGNNDNDEKGKTKSSGFGLNLTFSKWLQHLSFSKTQGYYLENTSEHQPGWQEGDSYFQFPEMEFKNFQGITAYKFNPNYSINAVATQTERQVKSAGSFIPQFLYRYYITDNKAAPTPGGFTQKSNNLELVLGAGYFYTFVLNGNFYIALGATPGAGVIFTNYTTRFATSESIDQKQQEAIVRLDGNAGLGFNGKRFFTGIYSKFSTSTAKQENFPVYNHDNRFSIQGFIGYRLNAPKWMREKVDAASNLIRL